MGQYDYMKGKTDEELVDMVQGPDLDTLAAAHVGRLLQVRNGQRQVEVGNALVRVTKQLTNATRLLAFVTVLMLLTAAAQVYLSVVGCSGEAPTRAPASSSHPLPATE